jgi:hypothetical protein
MRATPLENRKQRRAALNRARVARHAARRRAGTAVYPVEINAAIIDMLVRTAWLDDKKATDAQEVSRAIGALLADTADRSSAFGG